MASGQAYEEIYERITSLVNAENADAAVPTCPGWTVKDVISHLAGFFAVLEEHGMKGFDATWGDDVVKERREASLQECVAEWRKRYSRAEEISTVAISDALAHEQDIRNAIGVPGAQDDPNFVHAVQLALTFVGKKMEGTDAPSFRVVTDEIDETLGESEPIATLRTSTFELFRALQGRRTVDQVQELEWDGDPTSVLDVFFIFGPTRERVEPTSS